jgi:1-phosphofructokinase
MIVTVTMNPAIDKTIEIDKFIYNGLNRVRKVEYDAGGKGINVSKTIRELGGKSIATGFLGGNNGQLIDKVLKEHSIISDFVWVSGETRTNTKVVENDGTVTELNEPGGVVCGDDIQKLKDKLLNYANKETIFIFAGSIPNGVSKDIYRELIRFVKEKGAYVILDADGEAFCKALEEKPNFIKPNRAELEAYFGMREESDTSELLDAAKKIRQKGIENIVVSMGKEGALFLMENDAFICDGLSVKVSSTVGAGDAMVAAFAYAWECKLHLLQKSWEWDGIIPENSCKESSV